MSRKSPSFSTFLRNEIISGPANAQIDPFWCSSLLIRISGSNPSRYSSIGSIGSGRSMCLSRFMDFSLKPCNLNSFILELPIFFVKLFPHQIDIIDKFSIFFHFAYNLNLFAFEHFLISGSHLMQALFYMDEMAIDFFRGIIIFLLGHCFVFFLLAIILIDLNQATVPILGIHIINKHKYLEANLIIQTFFYFQRVFQLIVFLSNICLQFFYFF